MSVINSASVAGSDESERPMSVRSKQQIRVVLVLSLAGFLLAGVFGLWFRGVQAGYLDAAFPLSNMRHAHSHGMLFGWVTPILLYFILKSRGVSFFLESLLLMGLSILTSLSFLFFGYAPIPGFSVRIPPSVVLSSLHMLFWYRAAYLHFSVVRTFWKRPGHRRASMAMLLSVCCVSASVQEQFRIFFLHNMLLGFVSTAIMASWMEPGAVHVFYTAVVLFLAVLFANAGLQLYNPFLMVSFSTLPILAVVWLMIRGHHLNSVS